MEELKLGIEGEEGKIFDYLFDEVLIDGLFITRNSKKVQKNCENFDIEVESANKDGVNTKISKINNVSIVTLKQSTGSQFQFLVGNDMSVTELNKVPSELLSEKLKGLIFQAYQLHLFGGF